MNPAPLTLVTSTRFLVTFKKISYCLAVNTPLLRYQDQPVNAVCVHSAVRLTTGPQPLPKRVLYRLLASTSALNLQYSLSLKIRQ